MDGIVTLGKKTAKAFSEEGLSGVAKKTKFASKNE